MSPLLQRMVDATQVRSLSTRTIECYTESIGRLSRHYQGTNPARLPAPGQDLPQRLNSDMQGHQQRQRPNRSHTRAPP